MDIFYLKRYMGHVNLDQNNKGTEKYKCTFVYFLEVLSEHLKRKKHAQQTGLKVE